jgi:hypothetical protein
MVTHLFSTFCPITQLWPQGLNILNVEKMAAVDIIRMVFLYFTNNCIKFQENNRHKTQRIPLCHSMILTNHLRALNKAITELSKINSRHNKNPCHSLKDFQADLLFLLMAFL